MLATKHTAADTQRLNHVEQHHESQRLTKSRQKQWSFADKVTILGGIVVCTAAVWFLGSVGARIDSMNYSIDSLQSQVQQSAAENASLTAQADSLQQPARILGIALGKLHMQYKPPVQIGSTAAGQ